MYRDTGDGPEADEREAAAAPRVTHDVVVVGGGIVGLATARELALRGRRVLVLERERAPPESVVPGEAAT